MQAFAFSCHHEAVLYVLQARPSPAISLTAWISDTLSQALLSNFGLPKLFALSGRPSLSCQCNVFTQHFSAVHINSIIPWWTQHLLGTRQKQLGLCWCQISCRCLHSTGIDAERCSLVLSFCKAKNYSALVAPDKQNAQLIQLWESCIQQGQQHSLASPFPIASSHSK